MFRLSQPSIAVLVALACCLAGFATVAAQSTFDPNGDPTYGGMILQAGFVPDPFIATMYSGGGADASTLNLGENCHGYINTVPDYRLSWSGQGAQLRFFFVSDGDTTLVIQSPGGKYACNDDFDGLNPLVQFTNPVEGAYNIWVGSYNASEFVPGYLMISELDSSPAHIQSPLIASALTEAQAVPVTPMPPTEPTEISGVQYFPNLSVLHVQGRVNYPQTPPVGGEHAPAWLNCGIYDQPVPSENAVHSMEHGAVWITYQPTLPQSEVEALRAITRGGTHRLLSPFPGIPSPIVVSAWGYQLQLESASDPRLMQFIAQFEQGPTTPERGAPCSGGIGEPLP